MNLEFAQNVSAAYHSNSQIARVLTETWVLENMYCPRCGNLRLEHFANNRPVADFFCPVCRCEYELKSKNGSLSSKIADGAYDTMIERITSSRNPDFFFMNYSRQDWRVHDFMVVPKIFFVPELIEKRRPLAPTARRAGWTGCNIILDRIPEQGRIAIIRNGVPADRESVVKAVKRGLALDAESIKARSWLFDILNCVNLISRAEFTLQDIYAYEAVLSGRHPDNHNIKPKIRQQLQILRDKGFLAFMGNGRYRKV